ncbi:MAG: hypothetical protein ACTSWX_04270 [Promethearchaeota archaeon]
MNFLKIFIEKSKYNEKTIGIGLSLDISVNERIINLATKITNESKNKIVLVGEPDISVFIKKQEELNPNLFFVIDSNPCKLLVGSLFKNLYVSTSNGRNECKLDAIIRGGLSSSKFIKYLKKFGRNNSTNRLALLETEKGKQFFFIGVGIDEINTLAQKLEIMKNSISFLKKMEITPKIGILSGGRTGDLGRDPWIDENIKNSQVLERKLRDKYPEIDIKHYQILIEQAIYDNANLILAPEGIAGNLIYRTLVHLGGGRSYGAIYLKAFNNNKIIIDCSRVAPTFELEGAIYLALGI